MLVRRILEDEQRRSQRTMFFCPNDVDLCMWSILHEPVVVRAGVVLTREARNIYINQLHARAYCSVGIAVLKTEQWQGLHRSKFDEERVRFLASPWSRCKCNLACHTSEGVWLWSKLPRPLVNPVVVVVNDLPTMRVNLLGRSERHAATATFNLKLAGRRRSK